MYVFHGDMCKTEFYNNELGVAIFLRLMFLGIDCDHIIMR